MRRRAPLLLAGLVALAIAVFALVVVTSQRTLAFTLGVPPGAPVAPLQPGQHVCQTPISVPDSAAAFDRVQVLLGTYKRPGPPVQLTLLPAGGGPAIAHGSLAGGYPDTSTVDIPVGHVTTERPMQVCLRNAGHVPVAVYGAADAASRDSTALLDGKPLNADVALVFDRAHSRSLASLAPAILDRASLFRAGWVGSWTYILLALLVLLGVPALLWLALRGALRTQEEGGPPAPPASVGLRPPPRLSSLIGDDSGSLVARNVNMARSSVMVSASFLAANVFGGLLALLMSLIVGEGPDVDGFLAAYSAYLIFTLFGANLRVALVPVFGGTEDESAFRSRAREAVRRLSAAGAAMCAVLAAFSPLIGRVLVPGSADSAKHAAVVAVAILAAAAWCQIWSAGLSAVLAASQRFVVSALIYAGAGLTTVVIAAVLMPLLGVAGAAIGIAGSAIALLVAHTVYLRRFEFRALPRWGAIRERPTWGLVGVAAAGGAAPLAFQVLQSIALAGASGKTGTVTAYSYGYLLAALLSGVTGSTLGFTTMPQLVDAVRRGASEAIDLYTERLSAFAVFLYLAPAVAFATMGRQLMGAVLDGPLTPATVDLLWDLARIFLLMGLVWALLTPVTPLALAMRRFVLLTVCSVAIIPLGAVLIVLTHSHGPRAVAIAHASCAACLPVFVLVALFRGRAPLVALRAIRAAAPAFLFALIYPALAALGFDSTPAKSFVGIIIATAIYIGLAVKLWPSVGGMAVRLLRTQAGS